MNLGFVTAWTATTDDIDEKLLGVAMAACWWYVLRNNQVCFLLIVMDVKLDYVIRCVNVDLDCLSHSPHILQILFTPARIYRTI